MGHAISNLALGVGQSFLCRSAGGWAMCFLTTTFPNALAHPHPPPPLLFAQSLTILDLVVKNLRARLGMYTKAALVSRDKMASLLIKK